MQPKHHEPVPCNVFHQTKDQYALYSDHRQIYYTAIFQFTKGGGLTSINFMIFIYEDFQI